MKPPRGIAIWSTYPDRPGHDAMIPLTSPTGLSLCNGEMLLCRSRRGECIDPATRLIGRTAPPKRSEELTEHSSRGAETFKLRESETAVDEFCRGAEQVLSKKTLFDPTRPAHNSHLRVEANEPPRRQHVEPPLRRTEPAVKKLFNPDRHDPHSFHPRPVDQEREAPSSSSRSILRRVPTSRIAEEEADRERERRRRKEGSERGSQASKRKDSDAKSKGSRSSEGSESLRDRERGKGKG